MPYAFMPRDAGVPQAVRRIAREEIDAALAAVTAEGPLGVRVHTMRKSVKKLRGLIRLVRPVMKGFAAENAALRDAGRGISALRDAEVMRATAAAIAETLPGDGRDRLMAPFASALAAVAEPAALEASLAPFAVAMTVARDRAEGWKVRGDEFDALAPGLIRTWDNARHAMQAALRHPASDHVHEWRKRAKDHWYQARLLAPIWPRLMDPHVAVADDLGETLGLWNDHAVLAQRVAVLDLPEAVHEAAAAAIAARRDHLFTAAAGLGRRLFAGSGTDLANRWSVWWKLWRAEAG